MGGGDHCCVWGCDNDRRYPEKQIIKPHVGILRFYSPLDENDRKKWNKLINRWNFTAKFTSKVCSNHFSLGYRCKTTCRDPTLYMKGYEESNKSVRPPPKTRSTMKPKKSMKRKLDDQLPIPAKKIMLESEPKVQNMEMENDSRFSKNNQVLSHGPWLINQSENPTVSYITSETGCQTEIDSAKLKRDLFIDQTTCHKNCYRYTGLPRDKLDLVFYLIEEKAKSLRYWKGSVDTNIPSSRKKNLQRKLSSWEELVLTLVRTRKKFDVNFLADTFEISAGQVSRIYNTWILFLSEELSFLVPWPSQLDIKKNMPEQFKIFPNLRIIIDCLELFIQKPKRPSSQKITWSNYKHHNTAKLLIGITPDGVISFVPPLWTGLISDKEIVRGTGLIDFLEEGDAVMADRGFLIRDLLTFKKIHLISPAFCRGPRLSARATTYSRRVASLRSHVEIYILKLKQFRILSGVIPLTLKPLLDRIVFIAAALSNLSTKPISSSQFK